jgi:hypothetical protein
LGDQFVHLALLEDLWIDPCFFQNGQGRSVGWLELRVRRRPDYEMRLERLSTTFCYRGQVPQPLSAFVLMPSASARSNESGS